MKVAIERLNLASLGRMGCLLGAVAAFLPSLLCGLLGFALAALASGWLESWQDLTISLLGQEIARFDLIEFFGLDAMLEPIIRSSVDLLTSEQIDRIARCRDDRGCGWLFLDRSRSKARQWCSMADCGNRAKARRHYRRRAN